MKLKDSDLTRAAKQVAAAMGSAPFSEEEQAFSPAFEGRMARMMRQHKRRRLLKKAVCAVASVLLVLVTAGGLFLTFDLEAQAAVRAWYRSISAERYTYHFTEDRRGQPLPDYKATWLPEGYRHSQTRRYENTTLVGYKKEDPKARYIIPMGLEYFWISDQVTMIVREFGGHSVNEYEVTVNGIPAHLYEDFNPWNETTHYVLVWIDQEAGLVFRLGTSISAEETIAVAESVRPVE